MPCSWCCTCCSTEVSQGDNNVNGNGKIVNENGNNVNGNGNDINGNGNGVMGTRTNVIVQQPTAITTEDFHQQKSSSTDTKVGCSPKSSPRISSPMLFDLDLFGFVFRR
ncbi:unnamed protein product [Rotaria socialis]|nr:unnamed protein product [Rotaria socialis]CAF4550411.1 unnamed protein product [Rotaria socialis]CAF4652186.1 unnamed protein product [Rotaria socialis]CAF4876733.1 unnamed protein product [Rotaria socialis]CAF4907760.1 unnamed protein product [Rotaria socialis]